MPLRGRGLVEWVGAGGAGGAGGRVELLQAFDTLLVLAEAEVRARAHARANASARARTHTHSAEGCARTHAPCSGARALARTERGGHAPPPLPMARIKVSPSLSSE